MKLILKQYLCSLKERGELDAILPDLLREMGLTVISSPMLGTRQYGVDIAAVGSINHKPETVYLFSLKSGDLSRKDWDGSSNQALRPSLNEILDAYIPTHLSAEHKDKPIVICICIGGEIKEDIRLTVTQFEKERTTSAISFEEWNGDYLVSLIEKYLLREKLLPENLQTMLRKSLALLDEPMASFEHFSQLVKALIENYKKKKPKEITRSLRQLNLCLWILFSWGRDANNLESPYLASERALLYA